MRLENYETSVRRLLDRARVAHRNGSKIRAAELREEADGLQAQGVVALAEAQARLAQLATESAVQAVEDDAYLRRLKGEDDGRAA